MNMVHSGQPNVDILCGIQGCVSRFKSCKSWNNHVGKRHKAIYQAGGDGESDDETVEIEQEMESGEMDEICQPVIGIDNFEENANAQENLEAERKKRHARILLSFKEDNRLTQNTTQQFVQCVNYFASDIISECKKVFSEQIKEKGVDLDINLNALETPRAGLETPWQQEAYFREVFNCVVNFISKFYRTIISKYLSHYYMDI